MLRYQHMTTPYFYYNSILISLVASFALSLPENKVPCMLGHFPFWTNINKARSAFVSPGGIPKPSCRRHYFGDVTGYSTSVGKSKMSQNNPRVGLCSKPSVELEVEQKFALLLDEQSSIPIMEEKLISMGFQPTKQGKGFVDTYFDVPQWKLSLNDHWLRYRQLNGPDPHSMASGAWQLKRRPPPPSQLDPKTNSAASTISKATVYEELEGDEAIKSTFNFLTSIVPSDADEEDQQLPQVSATTDAIVTPVVFETYPEFPTKFQEICKKIELQPFAQFETIQSSWQPLHSSDQKHKLSVELDATDFGHMVGEVEAIVYRKEDVDEVKIQIEELIKDLTNHDSVNEGNGSEMPPIRGNLETYLAKFSPDHLKACEQAGIL